MTTMMPHDIGSEQATLGGLLEFPSAIIDVIELLSTNDFYRPAHQTIFATIIDLFADDKPTGAVATLAELSNRQQLDRIGGASYIHDLVAQAVTPSATAHFARTVADNAVRRRLAEVGMAVQQMAVGPAQHVDDLVDRAQAAVYGVSGRNTQDTTRTVGDLLSPTLAMLETAQDGPQGVLTGITDLDEALGGLRPGQMWVVAARPGVGKSTLALGLAAHTAIRQKIPCLYFSLEMPAADLMLKLLAAEAGVLLNNLRSRNLSDSEWERIAARLPAIADAPLHIDDAGTVTVAEVRAKARRLHQRDGLGLLVVDYLQLLASDGKSENRQQAVAAMSGGLRALSRDLNIPIIAVSQLNRSSEQRADRRPTAADIRESGQIEQDADGIVLLHREDIHNSDSARAGEVDLIVDKNRNGPRGTVTAAWQGHYSRIVDMAPEWMGESI